MRRQGRELALKIIYSLQDQDSSLEEVFADFWANFRFRDDVLGDPHDESHRPIPPEVREYAEGLVRGVAGLIRRLGMEKMVLVSSFRPASLELFRALCPEVPVGLLLDEKASAAPLGEILRRLRDLGARALHPSVRGLEPGRVAAVRAAGFDVNVYTVNREEDMLRLAREGAAGIITDFPARARAVLEHITTDKDA